MTARTQALLYLVLLAAVLSTGVAADADLWWHLSAGTEVLQTGPPAIDTWSYIAAGRPWIHHEWVYGTALALVFEYGGQPGLLLFRFGWLALTAAAMGIAVYRRTEHGLLTVLLVGLPLPLIATLSNLRPQTVTWALVPVAVVALDALWAGRKQAVWACVLLVWVWVNLHGGFLFGWGLIGLGLLTSALGVDAPKQRRAWLGIGALFVVPWINAYGPALLHYVFRELTINHPGLPEWNAPQGPLWVIVIGLALCTLASSLVRRPRWALLVAFLVATVASLRAAKFVQLLLLLTPILVAPAAAVLYARLVALPDGDRVDSLSRAPLTSAVLTALLALYASRFLPSFGEVSVDTRVYPMHAVARLAAHPTPGRLVVPLGWGGLAHHHLPGWTVSLDGRNTTVYAPSWVSDHDRAMRNGDLEVLLRGEPDAALVRPGSPADTAFEAAGWHRVLNTSTATLWTQKAWPETTVKPIELR